mmetsp:Transcript_2956/g.6363  ORF Transcript_2956/g.6363 Transcript_2956/m.6363 type:complete len:172 (-) Transcript_2956:899-1414(-)
MHLLKSSLFVDQIAACGEGDLCYVRNDHYETVNFSVAFEAWDIEDMAPLRTYEYGNKLEGGSIDWFELPFNFTLDTQVILVKLNVHGDSFVTSDPMVSETVYLKDMPKSIKGLHNPVLIEILDIHGTQNGDAAIILRSDKLALFVVLTTRAEGVFSDNCFFLRPSENKVSI